MTNRLVHAIAGEVHAILVDPTKTILIFLTFLTYFCEKARDFLFTKV